MADIDKISAEVPSPAPTVSKSDLLDLSNEVLLLILSELDACDLIALSKTCKRFSNLALDYLHWIHVDCRDDRFNEETVQTVLKMLTSITQSILLDYSFYTRTEGVDQTPVMKIVEAIKNTCPDIHTLLLEYAEVGDKDFKLELFPPSLRYLSLKGIEVKHTTKKPSDRPNLSNISVHMPILEVLDLSDSALVTHDCGVALSQCTQLRELNLYAAYYLENFLFFDISDENLKCLKLEKIDLRGTKICHHEIKSYRRLTKLRHLFLKPWEMEDFDPITDESIGLLLYPVPPRLKRKSKAKLLDPPQLETLVLGDVKGITDFTLLFLTGVMSIRHLDVSGTSVTSEVVEEFRRNRPDVEVVFSSGSSSDSDTESDN